MMLSSECNINLMSEKHMYPKFCCYHDNHLEKLSVHYIFPEDERYLKFLFGVCISLCTDEIGLSNSKGNARTLCYTPEIHEFLVKIKGVTYIFFYCGNHISKLKWDLFSFLE